ncbi:unnamed protein product [Trichogramma brassicae]|uniref:Reverse transcriptase domain-containing protein n=1 Tax=Trichogramma brassicae TaxID=86971 RepID=A0A6H5I5M1_9HYME|nr:unnamed protein product [Trichogramma brassicae]
MAAHRRRLAEAIAPLGRRPSFGRPQRPLWASLRARRHEHRRSAISLVYQYNTQRRRRQLDLAIDASHALCAGIGSAHLSLACLRTGVFRSVLESRQRALSWRPKPGKPPKTIVRKGRSICWTQRARFSERIICDRLEATTESPGGLSDHQYSFSEGRSTINAIENVIATAREAIAGKRLNRGTAEEYCAVVTLDVKNAFNSARWNTTSTNAALTPNAHA